MIGETSVRILDLTKRIVFVDGRFLKQASQSRMAHVACGGRFRIGTDRR